MSSDVCLDCPAGSYNSYEGQTRLGCILCPKGTASNNVSAVSIDSCIPCQPGQYSSEGASTCSDCSPGSYSDKANSDTCTLCPKNTYNSQRGSTSSTACLPCPGKMTTAVAGSTSIDDCIATTFTCPPGFQSKSSNTPTSINDCVPLACRPPLQPITSTGTIVNSNISGAYCAGCPPSTFGIPGYCSSSSSINQGEANAICPGFLAIGLPTTKALSLYTSGYNGTWICTGGSIPLREIIGSSSSTVSTSSNTNNGQSIVTTALQEAATRDINGVIAGGSILVILSFIALIFILRQNRKHTKTKTVFSSTTTTSKQSRYQHPLLQLLTKYMTRALEMVDAFALQHNLQRGQAVTREPTPFGGMCSIAGYATLFVLAIVLIIRRNADNELIQESLSVLDDNVLNSLNTMKWTLSSQASIPKYTTTQGHVRFRVVVAGDMNKPCEIETWSTTGITHGHFQYASDYPDRSCYYPKTTNLDNDNSIQSSSPFISHLVWSCSECLLSPHSSLTFTLPSSCQTLVMEAITIGADGSVTQLSTGTHEGTDSPTEIQRVIDYGPIKKITWSVLPLLVARRDIRTGEALRGYTIMDGGISIDRYIPTLLSSTIVSNDTTSITHTYATSTETGVSVTISMNLQPFYTLTILSEKTSVLQLFANIAGLMGIFSIFGILFREIESRFIGIPHTKLKTEKSKQEDRDTNDEINDDTNGMYNHQYRINKGSVARNNGISRSNKQNSVSSLSWLRKRFNRNNSTTPLSTAQTSVTNTYGYNKY